MDPKLRKRFVDSIEYLRKMDFFKDYSNLTSEEILNKIFNGEIDYEFWWKERKGREKRHLIPPWGEILKEGIEMKESFWMKSSDAEIDYRIIPFDTKRVMKESPRTVIDDELGIIMLRRLARISRGVFQPSDISEEYVYPDPELGNDWTTYRVYFMFSDERHSVKITLEKDYFHDLGLRKINELIKDTGYQYYQINKEDLIVVVLTKEEAERLEKERGWKFKYEIYSLG
ncbi:MAG: hypothetical protein QXI42_04070 [Thermoproteota archaeon]